MILIEVKFFLNFFYYYFYRLEPSANVHYRVIASHNFLYDSSLLLDSKKIIWPFTLDYPISVLPSNNGPTESFRGLWEIPTHINYDPGMNNRIYLNIIFKYAI